MSAPLLGGQRQLVVEDTDAQRAWVRVNGYWYPAPLRTAWDKQLSALSILVPCLGVALKYGFKTRQFFVAMALTTLLYFPGLFYALFMLLVAPRRPSREELEAAPHGYVFGTDLLAEEVISYSSLD